ncbi:MAG: hypothetical protein RBR28_09100 [Lentimicrobium sp.]|jgi:hypothetical protein|nr:hypothetical protein [Lentimicrobium sp.]
METRQVTSKEFFRSLTIVFYAMIIGTVFFAAISFSLHQLGFEKAEMDVFKYIVPLLIIIGIVGGNFMFKKQLKVALSKIDLLDKLNNYRSALIIRYAFLEGSAFFTIAVYLVTGNMFFLGLAFIPILSFLLFVPSIEKTQFDLELNHDEKQRINTPETVLGSMEIGT